MTAEDIKEVDSIIGKGFKKGKFKLSGIDEDCIYLDCDGHGITISLTTSQICDFVNTFHEVI